MTNYQALSSTILNWDPHNDGGSVNTTGKWRRPYQLIRHVEALLNGELSADSLANAIGDLRKAIDIRIRQLNDSYALRKVPLPNLPSDVLDILGSLGVVRPLMLKKLIELRNKVEHEDEKPPDIDSCKVFLDFTWYFVRSTDYFVRIHPTTLVCEHSTNEMDYWAEFHFNFPNGEPPSLRGLVAAELLPYTSREGDFVIRPTRLEKRKSGSVFIEGQVRGDAIAMRRLFSAYFEATV